MIDQKIREQTVKLIEDADAIMIGAGSGLSTSAGLEYSGKRFTDNFADYIEKYNLTDMYSAGFYSYPTLEEKWGYFSRHIKLNRYDAAVGKVYLDLLKLVEDKEYFVITTNVDAQFFKAGFDHDKVFATQGDYGKLQCENACHDTLYDNENIITQMVEEQSDCRIPSKLIPICPVCGGFLDTHLRKDSNFVENAEWKSANNNYLKFIKESKNKNLVLIELGVGFNTPSIIRWPFEKIAITYENSRLIRINKDNVQAKLNIPSKSILIRGDISDYLAEINN